MTISRFLSGWVKSCLHSHALSVFSFVLLLFAFCASGTMASAAAQLMFSSATSTRPAVVAAQPRPARYPEWALDTLY